MNDARFEHMNLDGLQAMMREMVMEGPPTEPSDSEFLKALAHEIGLREKQVQEGNRTEWPTEAGT